MQPVPVVAIGTLIIFLAGWAAYEAWWRKAPKDAIAVQRFRPLRMALLALALALVLGGIAEKIINH